MTTLAMESFWSSLKRELVPRVRFATRTQARAAVFEWIEIFYNRERFHSALGYKSPVDFETQLNWKFHVSMHPPTTCPPIRGKANLLVVFNPQNEPVTKKLRVNLYYAGVTGAARIREKGGPAKRFKLARDYTAELPVTVPAQGMN